MYVHSEILEVVGMKLYKVSCYGIYLTKSSHAQTVTMRCSPHLNSFLVVNQ